MKKLFATMVLSLSVLSASAQSLPQDSLETAVRELRYALTTEWDGQDTEFRARQVSLFAQRVRSLRETQGLTEADLLTAITADVADEKVRRELSELNALVRTNALTSEEALEKLAQTLAQSGAKGASYDRSYAAEYVNIMILPIAMVLFILGASTGAFDEEE